jgi:eukaryotic-like serine/threonine-protein kinase
VLLPTGAGEARPVVSPGLEQIAWARWLPDGKRMVLTGNQAGRPGRVYVHDLGGGAPVPVTPEGSAFLLPHAPDGHHVLSTDADGRVLLYSFEGEAPRVVPGIEPGEVPLRWSGDGRYLFVRRRDDPPLRIDRLEVASGRREGWLSFVPADPAGVLAISSVLLTPDGRSYVYTYHRLLSELFLVDGLR